MVLTRALVRTCFPLCLQNTGCPKGWHQFAQSCPYMGTHGGGKGISLTDTPQASGLPQPLCSLRWYSQRGPRCPGAGRGDVDTDTHTHTHRERSFAEGVYCSLEENGPGLPGDQLGSSRDDHVLMPLEGDRTGVSPPVPVLKDRAQNEPPNIRWDMREALSPPSLSAESWGRRQELEPSIYPGQDLALLRSIWHPEPLAQCGITLGCP